jgi:uncharacterized protein YecT (DUF1311 family)
MMARNTFVLPGFGLSLVAALAGTPARAEPVGGCDPAIVKGPALTQCLTEAEKTSSADLETTVQAVLASIATRKGVFDTQRARWKNSLTISQEAWVRFRNDECQNVAPFEGQALSTSALRNRVAAFEAKLICTIEMNTARAADLARRYPNE